MGVLSILLGIGWSFATTQLAQSKVREAAEQFARDVQSQHFEAKRRNTTRTIQVNSTNNTYTIGTSIYQLPSGVRFTSGSTGNITFHGPYGTTISNSGVAGPNLQTFTLISTQKSSFIRTVTVVGLIGKVIVK